MLEALLVLVFCIPIVAAGVLVVVESIRDEMMWSKIRKESQALSDKRWLEQRIADKERDLFGY